jgi:Rrf2 family protein
VVQYRKLNGALMLALSHTSGYAVLALSCLDDPGQRWVLAKDIVKCTGAPAPYLSQILHALSRAGLIETKRGYQGGYRLCRPARAISVLEVVEAVDGPECLGGCLLGLERCSDERACPTHEFWKAEKARIRAKLAGLSLSEVADYERRVRGCCGPGAPTADHLRGDGRAGRNRTGQGAGLLARSAPNSKRAPRARTSASAASTSRKPPGKSTARRRRPAG